MPMSRQHYGSPRTNPAETPMIWNRCDESRRLREQSITGLLEKAWKHGDFQTLKQTQVDLENQQPQVVLEN